MGKKINYRIYCTSIILLSAIQLFSQEVDSQAFDENIVWVAQDSIDRIIFNDTSEVVSWSKGQLPMSAVYSRSIVINDTNVFVLVVSGCSGIPCWNVFVFKGMEEYWELVKKAKSRSLNKIILKIDFVENKINFVADENKLGELLFESI